MFVENVLLSQMLKNRSNYNSNEAKGLILSSSSSFELATLAKFGIGVGEVASLISPFVLEATK
jgi:hypothetical protein